jgi:hypothetical protein
MLRAELLHLSRSTMEDHMSKELTPASLELFLGLAEDAPNWSGSPLVTVSPAERGNLTNLKKLGLIETFVDEGCAFAVFTDKGVALAVEHGFDAELLRFG